MYPSCSEYSRSALRKHGPVLGWFMACDRLIRCGRNELDYAPKIPVNGKWRYFDPLSANDFWLKAESLRPGYAQTNKKFFMVIDHHFINK